MTADEIKKLIDLTALGKGAVTKKFFTIVEKLLSIKWINDGYRQVEIRDNPCDFFKSALKVLDVDYQLDKGGLARIPLTGPLLTVSNHPFGGIEGVVMGALMMSLRPDVKILGNYLLQEIDEIKDCVIAVDPFGNQSSTSSNSKAIKEAIRWVKNGGCLVTFPAGEVSSLNLKKRRVTDPKWIAHIAAIVRLSRADVLPVFFNGRNSTLFQSLGLIHPRFRTALLPRELRNKQHKTLQMEVGTVMSAKSLSEFNDNEALIENLRLNTYFLANRRPQKTAKKKAVDESHFLPIIDPISTKLLEQDLKALDASHLYVERKEVQVYIAKAAEIPNVLREIGRLREETFRAAKEGTGLDCDLDKFDDYYLHLFMWNSETCEIMGAYRLGLADEIVEKYGKKGLYTNTLFKFRTGFIEQMGTGLELGRSFVATKYQRKQTCLAMLWRGIGGFVARHPQYRMLFGPVSISQDYQSVSKSIMIQYMKANMMDDLLAKYVSPRKPYKASKVCAVDRKSLGKSLKDIENVSMMVSEVEQDGKGIPVLLRHYLKLNARLISFNVDAEFANVVDGLILVDMLHSGDKFLKKFMGLEGREDFYKYHDHSPEVK